MNTAPDTAPIYLVDNHANLHIHMGEQRMVLAPDSAVELMKFLERTQYQPGAQLVKRGAA